MASRTSRPRRLAVQLAGELTVEDWFSTPDDGNQYELVEGVLRIVTLPGREHQDLLGDVAVALGLHVRANGGYAGIAPLGVALGRQDGFEPDVVYVAPGRESILTERGVEGVPDLVVEILSPSTRAFDRGTKLRRYLELGVREVWLVDPVRRETVLCWSGGERAAVPFGAVLPSRVLDIGDAGLAAPEAS